MNRWVAVSYGALDMSGLVANDSKIDYLVLAVFPAEPIGLNGEAAALWSRFVHAPVSDSELSEAEMALALEFELFGIASRDEQHPARVTELATPWFASPLHEMVCSLVASIARDAEIGLVFIKGPTLQRQGLRERDHSGDVDLWVDPADLPRLVEILQRWGWSEQHGVWGDVHVNHSVTLEPGGWGCELDLHRHFPGVGVSEPDAFSALSARLTPLHFASVLAQVPSLATHAVIMALHSLRPVFGEAASLRQQETAMNALRAGGAETIQIASAFGSIAPLHDAFAWAYPGQELPPRGQLPKNWVWRGKSNRVSAYLYALKMVPTRDRARIVWRLVWPTRDAVFASDRLAGESSQSAVGARMRRIRRGLRSVWSWRR